MDKKLQRNGSDKMIGGVASGLGEYLDIDVAVMRIIFVLMAFFGLSGVLIYIILWIVVPLKKQPGTYTEYTMEKQPAPENPPHHPPSRPKRRGRKRVGAGIILVILGIYFLCSEFGLIPHWFAIYKLWPLLLIIPGILILTAAQKNRCTVSADDTPQPEQGPSVSDEFTQDNKRDINSDQPLS